MSSFIDSGLSFELSFSSSFNLNPTFFSLFSKFSFSLIISSQKCLPLTLSLLFFCSYTISSAFVNKWTLQLRFQFPSYDSHLFDCFITLFLTFADLVFDGFLTDILVQSKISKAKEQCDEAIERVTVIRRELEAKLY